ncbi:MAG: polysaccharide deacetylase family protein [Paracoccaceae bacterium]
MLSRIAKAIDLVLARIQPFPASGLTILGFHGLWPDLGVAKAEATDPYQPFTLADLDQVIGILRATGATFVCGRDLDRPPAGPAVWLTFDDGYANNLDALPILRRHGVPATFFITSGNINSGDAYWWDVLYREGRKLGTPAAALATRREALKALPPDAIRATLIAHYGPQAFHPTGAQDRPMTPAELAAFAKDPLVEIGNHTLSHAILPVLPATEQRAEIHRCQQELTALTERVPQVIAYPNGGVTAETLHIAQSCGLNLGVTCLPHRNAASELQDPLGRLTLGRFMGLRHGALTRETALAVAPRSLGQSTANQTRQRLMASAGPLT